MPIDSEDLGRASPPPADETIIERRALVDRISESPQFRKAPRTRDLFRYLATRAIRNQMEATEYEIASDVFGRKEDFDPAESNVVRITMRQLRQKLKEYYEQLGAAEKWRIEFPRGSYGAVFSLLSSPPPEPEQGDARSSVLRWRVISALLASLLLVSLGLVFHRSAQSPQPELPRQGLPFLASLASTFEGPIRIVGADSAFSLIRQFRPGDFTLKQYEDRDFIAKVDPESLGPFERRMWDYLITRQYLNVADVSIGLRLSSYLPQRRAVLDMARHLKARDFRHGNFILLGTGTSNPWHMLFQDQLNFYFTPPSTSPQEIVNRAPLPGEPRVFRRRLEDDESFGIVSMLRNITGSGHVVLIAGFTMEATEACGDFVLKAEQRPVLLRALGVASEAELEGFEVLLRTTAVSGTGRGSQIVAVRARRRAQ